MSQHRRFEFTAGTSAKFWEVVVEGAEVETRWGRLGTDGRSKRKAFGDAAAAEKEAAKLIREKTRKGYQEVAAGTQSKTARKKTAKKKTAKKKTAKKKTAKKKTTKKETTKKKTAKKKTTKKKTAGTAAPAAIGPPGEFAFTAALDRAFARGWPHLHVLVDGGPKSASAQARAALKQLWAIDPVWDVEVPRAVAHRYLRAFMAPRRNADFGKAQGPRWEAALVDEPFPEREIEALFAGIGVNLAETYEFPIVSAVHLLEALFGTERVFAACVARLVELTEEHAHRKKAPSSGYQYDNESFNHLCLLRATATLWPRLGENTERLCAPLRDVRGDAGFERALRWLGGAGVPATWEGLGLRTPHDVAVARGEAGVIAEFQWTRWWRSPRLFLATGLEVWNQTSMADLPKLAKWHQLRVASWFGAIRHPATVRAMLWLLRGRSARKEALAWIEAHAGFARAEIERAVGHPKLGEPARLALEALGGAGLPVDDRELSCDEVTAEVAKLIAQLGRDLPAAGGDPERERALLAEAYEAYCEVRAAAGDVIPGAYFTHQFIDVDWNVSEAAFARWMDLAVEVAGS